MYNQGSVEQDQCNCLLQDMHTLKSTLAVTCYNSYLLYLEQCFFGR